MDRKAYPYLLHSKRIHNKDGIRAKYKQPAEFWCHKIHAYVLTFHSFTSLQTYVKLRSALQTAVITHFACAVFIPDIRRTRSFTGDRQLTDLMEISSLRGSPEAALIAWFPDQGVLWLDGSIIILTRFIALPKSCSRFWSSIFFARSFEIMAYCFCGCRDFIPDVWLTYL